MDEFDRAAVGQRIKKERAKKKLTQAELAKRLICNKSHISKIETGKYKEVDVGEVEKIAKALDVRTEYLLGMDSATDEAELIVRGLDKLFKRVTTTKRYCPPECNVYVESDLLMDLSQEYLMLTGEKRLFELILSVAKIRGTRGLSLKERSERYSKAKRKYTESGSEQTEEKYLIVTSQQLNEIVTKLVAQSGYVERLLKMFSEWTPLDE